MAANRNIAVKSGFWSAILQWSRFGINTVVFLILMRWLSLEEIGAFASAFALVKFFQAIQQSGFSDAVIQRSSKKDSYINSIFWMSTLTGFVITVFLYVLSFWFGSFIGDERSGNYLEILAVIPLLIGLSAVPEGLLRKKLHIKQLAIRTSLSLSVSGVIALVLGYYGYGGWALTIFALINAFTATALVFLFSKWRPSGGLVRSESRDALPIILVISGRNVASAAIIPTLQIFVGVYFGAAAAGAFQIAYRFLTMLETLAVTPFRYVALPLFSKVNNDPERLKSAVLKSIGFMSLLTAPLYCGLYAVSPVFLPLVVGENNADPAAFILQAFCLSGISVVVASVFDQSLTSIGKPNLGMYRAIAILVLSVAMCLVAINYSVVIIGFGFSLVGIIILPFMLLYLRKELKVNTLSIMAAIGKPYIACGIMSLGLIAVGDVFNSSLSNVEIFVLQLVVGIIASYALLILFARSQMRAAIDVLSVLRAKDKV